MAREVRDFGASVRAQLLARVERIDFQVILKRYAFGRFLCCLSTPTGVCGSS